MTRPTQHTIDDAPYRDEDTLRELYVDEMLSTPEIAERLGTTDVTIGNWLETFGIDRRPNGKVPADALLTDLERLGDEFDRTPTTQLVIDHGRFSDMTYYERFGSFTDALRKAGFEPNVRHDITDSELVEAMQGLADEVGRTPRQSDMADRGDFSVLIYQKRFGSWNEALTAAGFEPTHRVDIPREELVADLHRIADEHGTPLREYQLRAHGRFSWETYNRRFGSWLRAVALAGYEPYDRSATGPAHPSWKGGSGIVREQVVRALPQRWSDVAPAVIDAHDGECAGCGATESSHGQQLDVHHIVPVVAGGTNDSELLLPLCRSCHLTAERYTEPLFDAHLTE